MFDAAHDHAHRDHKHYYTQAAEDEPAEQVDAHSHDHDHAHVHSHDHSHDHATHSHSHDHGGGGWEMELHREIDQYLGQYIKDPTQIIWAKVGGYRMVPRTAVCPVACCHLAQPYLVVRTGDGFCLKQSVRVCDPTADAVPPLLVPCCLWSPLVNAPGGVGACGYCHHQYYPGSDPDFHPAVR